MEDIDGMRNAAVNEERPSCDKGSPSLWQNAAKILLLAPMRNVPHWPE